MVERLLNAQTREETFNLLVLRESGRIYNMVRKMVLNHDDADDIVQGVFSELARKMPTFEYDWTKGKFRSYLLELINWRILDK